MASLGTITIPEITPAGTFPLVGDWPIQVELDYNKFQPIEHVMESSYAAGNFKISQRFLVGTGRLVHTVKRELITWSQGNALKVFFDDHKASYVPFTYNAPAHDGSVTPVTCVFADEPLSLNAEKLGFSCEVRLIELPTSPVDYTVDATVLRFPGDMLEVALAEQAQELIPLIHIKVREAGYPDNIYLSDRLCSITDSEGTKTYQPRLLDRSDITQAIDGQADTTRFTFGNADRVMRDLSYSTNLDLARIEFRLYHVKTRTLLQVWAGEITEFSGQAANQFVITASEPDLSRLYPIRKIDHQCWKTKSDGLNCTAADGPAAECDKTFDGPKGCKTHNNEREFGGHMMTSEVVRVKDNSTGLWGLMRRTITASSVVADSAFGEVLPLYFTDVPWVVNGKVVNARDDGDFKIGLVIAGQGPLILSGDLLGFRLNGIIAHGIGKDPVSRCGKALGFRSSNGYDPAAPGVGVFPTDNDNFFNLDEDSWRDSGCALVGPVNPYFSAGTAFCTIRIPDAKGLQPTAITEFQAQVKIDGGLGAWYWYTVNDRQFGVPMANPVWVAVNCFLDSRGLLRATAQEQAAVLDLDSLISTAAICADQVDSLLKGLGQTDYPKETQFRACGALTEQRALRDWLKDILNTCLGYFTFSFGRLRVGSKINSSTREAFTAGNVIRGSIRLERQKPEFNTLSVEYADDAYQFTKNTITSELADHVKVFHRHSMSMGLPFCPSRSQALRICATRVREECGGINEAEWKARLSLVSFDTTVLAIGTEPGRICSLTSDEMPNGSGEFRVTRWILHPDYSLTLEGTTTTDSMYDLIVGPKPADVLPGPLPVERIEEVLPVQPWFPNTEVPSVDDPIYSPTDVSFELGQRYDTAEAGSLYFRGEYPVVGVLNCQPPRVKTFAVGLGTIPAGSYITVCLVATDVNGQMTRSSAAVGVSLPSNGSIVLDNITWPAECIGGGYRLLAAEDRNLICEQKRDVSQPDRIVLDELPNIRTRGIPQPNLIGLIPKVRVVEHLGINGLVISSVSNGSITVDGAGWTPQLYADRPVAVFADRDDGSAPIWTFLILGNTSDTLTVNPDPASGFPSNRVEPGDVMSIMLKATAASETTIKDELVRNPQYPAGFAVGEEKGRIVRIESGTGKGQARLIVDNEFDTLIVTPAWTVIPDLSSVFVVLDAAYAYVGEVLKLNVAHVDNDVVGKLPIPNLAAQTLEVEVATIDQFGRESRPTANPRRYIYFFGTYPTAIYRWIISPEAAEPTGVLPRTHEASAPSAPNFLAQIRLRFDTAPSTNTMQFDFLIDSGTGPVSVFPAATYLEFAPANAGNSVHYDFPYRKVSIKPGDILILKLIIGDPDARQGLLDVEFGG